jgi:hypothetical protein
VTRESIDFTVEGQLPPKKDGTNSMWGEHGNFQRLRALRQAAEVAMKGQDPLRRNINLTLEVHCGSSDVRPGDLDNFITGVCDGLQKASARCKPNQRWREAPSKIGPQRAIGFENDAEVVSISASKTFTTHGPSWYRVVLEGER